MVAGEAGSITFHVVTGRNKTPFDVSGYNAELTAVDCVNQDAVQFSKKPSEVTAIDDLIVVRMEAKDTINVLPGKYLYQLEIWNDDNGPEVISEGAFFIRRNYKEVGAVEH